MQKTRITYSFQEIISLYTKSEPNFNKYNFKDILFKETYQIPKFYLKNKNTEIIDFIPEIKPNPKDKILQRIFEEEENDFDEIFNQNNSKDIINQEENFIKESKVFLNVNSLENLNENIEEDNHLSSKNSIDELNNKLKKQKKHPKWDELNFNDKDIDTKSIIEKKKSPIKWSEISISNNDFNDKDIDTKSIIKKKKSPIKWSEISISNNDFNDKKLKEGNIDKKIPIILDVLTTQEKQLSDLNENLQKKRGVNWTDLEIDEISSKKLKDNKNINIMLSKWDNLEFENS